MQFGPDGKHGSWMGVVALAGGGVATVAAGLLAMDTSQSIGVVLVVVGATMMAFAGAWGVYFFRQHRLEWPDRQATAVLNGEPNLTGKEHKFSPATWSLVYILGLMVLFLVFWYVAPVIFDAGMRQARYGTVFAPSKRDLMTVSPEMLRGLYHNRTTAEGDGLFAPYKGRWMKVTAHVSDVRGPDSQGERWISTTDRMSLSFSRSLESKVVLLRVKDEIEALCRIFSAAEELLMFGDCELLKEATSPSPASSPAPTPAPAPAPAPAGLLPVPSEQGQVAPSSPPKPAREYISLDFVDLYKRISQLNGVQAQKIADLYIGKWVKSREIVGNISVIYGSKQIMVFPPWKTPPPEGDTSFVFDEKWESEISALKAGDIITADCQISTLETRRITLVHCELRGPIVTDQPIASPPSPKRPALPPKR